MSLEEAYGVYIFLVIPVVVLTFAVYMTWRLRRANSRIRKNKKG